MAVLPCVVRRAAWIGGGAVAAVVAWLVGLVTFLAEVDGCTWWQRQAWLVSGAMMAAVLLAFWLVHRLPGFRQDRAGLRCQVLAGLLLVPWFASTFVYAPAHLGAVQRGRQQRTMNDMRRIGRLVEEYRRRRGTYPTAEGVNALVDALGNPPGFPRRDGWGHPWRLSVRANSYTIASFGRCGQPDPISAGGPRTGTASSSGADIVFSNGRFIRWPEGIAP